jgi:threonylcarbamoyladenosine tRNA methylthiotransferase MtaB
MRVKFFTLGCKVNQYEAQAIKEEFEDSGFKLTSQEADLYVINTCTVTYRADVKSKQAILRAKKENPQAKIAVIGCMVQLNSRELKDLGVDYIVGQDKKHQLLEIIQGKPQNTYKDIWSLKVNTFPNHRAFVKIQDGCDNFCSFCKIPYIRGTPLSRPKRDILEEIERLSPKHREIVLCGINISLYGRDLSTKENLVSLVEDILKIEGLGRVRLSSLEPRGISEDLLRLFENRKVCPHLHLPFQSGDDKVLNLMNKKETTSLYQEIVKKARKSCPSIAISCDIMVGFPSEDQTSFHNTVKFLYKVKPMRIHIFRFSPREMTIFQDIKIKNEGEVKRRYDFLRHLANKFSYEYKKNFLGTTLHMIAEAKSEGFVYGYTENYIRVYIKEEVPLGEVIPVKIDRISQDRVYGRVIKY